MHASIDCQALLEIDQAVEGVEGWLTTREVHFLATAAAHPTAKGSILELGSYKGKSTIAIALAARLAGKTHFATVDPLINGVRAVLDENLRRASVREDVEVHQMLSGEFIESWDRPIRFLFHDGSNQVEVVRRDLAELTSHFADGAIIAFHDVLNPSGYRAAVFADDVLTSDNFGPIGFCGSIGWGQYFSDCSIGAQYRPHRLRLRKRLMRLLPLLGESIKGIQKLRYKLLRSRIPHRHIDSTKWLRAAA